MYIVFDYVNNKLLTKNVHRGFQFDQSRLQTQGVLELSTQGQETLGKGIGVHLSPVKARLYMKERNKKYGACIILSYKKISSLIKSC